MPLKKPGEIPKIPKTREKKAEAAFNAIPENRPDKLEYFCKFSFQYDQKLRKQFNVITISTVAEFTSFAYEVSLEIIRDKKEINLVLMGLKALTNFVPRVQSAISNVRFEDLFGTYTVNVLKQDGAINTAEVDFNIYKKAITLKQQYKPKKKNNRKFCEFMVAEDKENTFAPKK